MHRYIACPSMTRPNRAIHTLDGYRSFLRLVCFPCALTFKGLQGFESSSLSNLASTCSMRCKQGIRKSTEAVPGKSCKNVASALPFPQLRPRAWRLSKVYKYLSRKCETRPHHPAAHLDICDFFQGTRLRSHRSDVTFSVV